MATVTNNVFTQGLRGLVGGDMVFRTYRGKTVVSAKPALPDKSKESVAQRGTRQRFKEATVFAKAAMQDPSRKSYYQQRARALKLPNAYTAAITDYMRKPVVQKIDMSRYGGQGGDVIMIQATKKGFALTAVEVAIVDGEGTVVEQGAARRVRGHDRWCYRAKETTARRGLQVLVKDQTISDMRGTIPYLNRTSYI